MSSPFSAQRYTSLRKDPIAFSGRNLVARYSYPKFKNQQKLEESLASIDTYTRHRSAKPPKTVPYLIYSRRKLIGMYARECLLISMLYVANFIFKKRT